jgi:L-malate glycosyltransferase
VKKNLVQVVLSLTPGGTERLVIDMARALSQEANVSVICLDEAGEWAPQLTEFGVSYEVLGRKPGFDWSLILKIRRILRRIKNPVVHCHHYTPFVYGALASMGIPGSRIVYTEHGRFDDGRPSLKRRIANMFFGHLRGEFFAVSHDLRKHLIAEGFPAKRMQVNHNGIDVGPIAGAAERAHARAILGFTDTDTVVGTIARLHPVKDLGVLLRAVAALETHPRVKIALVGDGQDRASLEDLARSLSISDRVVFAGQRDDARELLAALDIFVNCSIIEGISVTVLEAMATGLPVIATRVGGTPEVVVDKISGLLTPSRSPDSVTAALCTLLDNRELAGQLGSAARTSATTRFSMSTMLTRYRAAYKWDNVKP